MTTEIYLGNPPANIVDWIRNHSQPATRAETRIWWSSDESNYNDYLIEGALDCPALIEKGLMPEGSGTEFEPYWNNSPIKVEIGSAVTSIGDDVFHGSGSRFTSVTIPSTVMSIGNSAFYYCSWLTSVTIHAGVSSIGSSAFFSCTSLASITMPNSVTSIGSEAFLQCSGLIGVTIPDSMTSIGDYAFTDCESLTSVTITANGGNAENVKQMLINAGVSSSITWNMPS